MTPETVVVIIVGLYAAGLVLGVLHGVAPARGMRPVPARVYAVWALTGMLALAQPSVRQVLLDASDLYQGRWLFPALAPAAALAGVGLARLPARGFQVVPLVVLAGIASIWLVLLDIVRHHYVVFPTRLVRGSLFLRPTGEADAGDAQVLALIEGTLTAQEATWTWGILVLLGVASLWLAVSVIRHASSPARHG